MIEPESGDLLAQVTSDQSRASDPEASAWVSANAGSGKTHVLTERVVRLLLEGNRPSAILCLTYTKAAAAEMANRVFSRLAEWTRFDDDALAVAVGKIDGRPPGAGRLLVARQLFARALETPGGLKIQTIHAFCESVLHQFPLEANVAGHFEILDETAATALLAEARRMLLTAAAHEEDAVLADAFRYVLEAGGEAGLEKLLTALIAGRDAIRRFRAFAAAHGGLETVLRRALDLSPEEDDASIEASAWPLPSLAGEALETFLSAAEAGSAVTPRKFAAGLDQVATAEAGERWPLIVDLFMTNEGKPRILSKVTAGALLAAMPDAADRVEAAQAHVCACIDRLARFRVLEATRAALTLAGRFDQDYERLKRDRGRLDFDDLVGRTADLLARDGAGAWVHYKLDQGIDHILVDEAQDTSAGQWSVIRSLAEEFFAGEGARRARRTLFAVGDEKQSIYSFQGARPERFEEERRSVARRVGAAGQRFEPVRLRVSFRSTAGVLGAVDRVFSEPDNRRGLGSDAAIVHETARLKHPGSVDVWDMIRKEKAEEQADWTAPYDAVLEMSPPARLARRIAATIEDWIGRGTIVDRGTARRIRPGDVLVLVRKRDAFVQALNRELKQRTDIPVAGADRLRLVDHVAIQDLAALGRVMLLPEDDLSLASLLKSPLYGVSEEELYDLAAERGERESLFARLAGLAGTGREPWSSIHRDLSASLALVDRLPVFEFYARILAGGGRRRFLARLGHEASDVLDEFLSFALEHERSSGVPGLEAFLAVLRSDSPEIKREMDKGRDEVRIMTVHASKGLEAPVVFLVDSGGDAVHASQMPALRERPLESLYGEAPPAVLWVPGKPYENGVTGAIRAQQRKAAEEEYRRLLYVGMTRAADRLVVCGYQTPQEPKYRYWQAMVWEALEGEGTAAVSRSYAAAGDTWSGLHFSRHAESAAGAVEEPGPDAAPAPPLPDALRRPLPVPVRPPRPLSPSGASAVIDGEEPERSAGSPIRTAQAGAFPALERGRVVHRFLQVLPGMPGAERAEAAARYLDRACPGWPPAETAKIAGSVFAILDDPAFAPVFAAGSRAEVSIMGTLDLRGKPHVVSGRIDRLAVTEDRVLIVDYKTNRPPFLTAEDAPAAYRAQLAIYRAILAPLYPGRRLEAALVFTEAPVLVPVGPAMLDAALAALTPT